MVDDVSRMVVVPRVINGPRNVIPIWWSEGVLDGNPGGRTLPFVNFSMPVGKRETTGAVVIRSGRVTPVPRPRRGVANREERIIDRIRLLIERNPDDGGLHEVRLLKVLNVSVIVTPRVPL